MVEAPPFLISSGSRTSFSIYAGNSLHPIMNGRTRRIPLMQKEDGTPYNSVTYLPITGPNMLATLPID